MSKALLKDRYRESSHEFEIQNSTDHDMGFNPSPLTTQPIAAAPVTNSFSLEALMLRQFNSTAAISPAASMLRHLLTTTATQIPVAAAPMSPSLTPSPPPLASTRPALPSPAASRSSSGDWTSPSEFHSSLQPSHTAVFPNSSNFRSFPVYATPPQTAPEDLSVNRKEEEDVVTEASEDIANMHLIDNRRVSNGSSGALSESETSFCSREGGSHECLECGKSYSTSSNLARHRQTHRSLEDKKARKCPHCDKTYVSMPAFSMHLRTHNQGCKCPYCGKCFSRPWLLQGHIRTHTGEKPFSCNICEKSFADKSNLRAHVQTHSNTKPFVCSRCNKAFALKSYLYKHEESSCMKFEIKKVKEDRRKRTGPTGPTQSTPPPGPEAPPAIHDHQRAFLLQALAAVASTHAAYLPPPSSSEATVKTEDT